MNDKAITNRSTSMKAFTMRKYNVYDRIGLNTFPDIIKNTPDLAQGEEYKRLCELSNIHDLVMRMRPRRSFTDSMINEINHLFPETGRYMWISSHSTIDHLIQPPLGPIVFNRLYSTLSDEDIKLTEHIKNPRYSGA
jgi:hypothetical protein